MILDMYIIHILALRQAREREREMHAIKTYLEVFRQLYDINKEEG